MQINHCIVFVEYIGLISSIHALISRQWFLILQSLINGQWLLMWSLAVLSPPKSKHRAVAEPLSVKGFFFFFWSHSWMHHCYPFCFSWDFFSLNYISVFDVMSWRHICFRIQFGYIINRVDHNSVDYCNFAKLLATMILRCS